MLQSKKGFTLLEILLVIAIIAVLAAIVIIAINPTKQLAGANNAQRRMHVNTILNGIYQYAIDNKGGLPSGLDATYTTAQVLGTSGSGCDTTCTATSTEAVCLDLSSDLVPIFIADIPFDPSSGSAENTDYYVEKYPSGRIVVGACDAEESATISITR